MKVLRSSSILGGIIAILCFFNVSETIQSPEWFVDIGDSQTYVFTKVFDSRLDNPNRIKIKEYSDNGLVEITLKTGTIMSYTISVVSPFSENIIGYRTFNNNVSLIEESISGIVRRTINNRSYWEDYYNDDPLVRIEGYHIIFEDNHFVARDESVLTYFLTEKVIWDFRTGWLIFSSIKASYMGEAYYNVEYKLLERDLEDLIFNLPLNTIFGSIIFIVLGIALFGTRKRRQKHKSIKER